MKIMLSDSCESAGGGNVRNRHNPGLVGKAITSVEAERKMAGTRGTVEKNYIFTFVECREFSKWR